MTTVELLTIMRRKISSGWTQGCSARSRAGFPVVPYSDDACQWCLIGSMTADRNSVLYGDIRNKTIGLLMELIANRNEKPDLAMYNDSEDRTREQVLELIDEAISVANVGGFE